MAQGDGCMGCIGSIVAFVFSAAMLALFIWLVSMFLHMLL